MRSTRNLLSRLQTQHEALDLLIEGLTEEQLKRKVNPGKWSPFENIAHLAAYQPVFESRIDRIGSETEPAFERYVAESDPLFLVYLSQSLTDLTRSIITHGAAITMKLKGLREDEWQRAGWHPKYGRMTLVEWTEFYLLHEAHHLFTLFMLVRDPAFLPR
jgi:hypothetical protein